jgi:LPS-assembly protein
VQTFEPRLLYVNTPFRDQEEIPSFDAAPKDFNFTSLFSPNPFSGVDRVADAHQLTAGAYMRFIDEARGTEALRLGLAQRYLFREQTITPEGVPSDKRFSNVLLLGSTNLIPNWSIGASTQYNPDIRRTVRSSLSARYAPGPFRTIGASYSLVRNSSEQIDLGWQWPLYEGDRSKQGACAGSLYSVGRLNYSLRDSRLTDTLLGVEYDAGCWIGRFVVERRSTSQTEATTRLMFQVEFVGLSRLGSSPLRALRDNIPGYQLLREER